MTRLPEFLKHLEQMKTIHERKNQDYAQHEPLENFHRSAQVSEWFEDPVDRAFVVLITTKLARLATLLNSKRAPNNESIADSFLDLNTYTNLWWCDYERRAAIANEIRNQTANFEVCDGKEGDTRQEGRGSKEGDSGDPRYPECSQCNSNMSVQYLPEFKKHYCTNCNWTF